MGVVLYTNGIFYNSNKEFAAINLEINQFVEYSYEPTSALVEYLNCDKSKLLDDIDKRKTSVINKKLMYRSKLECYKTLAGKWYMSPFGRHILYPCVNTFFKEIIIRTGESTILGYGYYTLLVISDYNICREEMNYYGRKKIFTEDAVLRVQFYNMPLMNYGTSIFIEDENNTVGLGTWGSKGIKLIIKNNYNGANIIYNLISAIRRGSLSIIPRKQQASGCSIVIADKAY